MVMEGPTDFYDCLETIPPCLLHLGDTKASAWADTQVRPYGVVSINANINLRDLP